MSSFVLALTGPTGAGKSTVGEEIAKSFDRCVNIDADHIKHMIVSGFNEDGTTFHEWELVGDSIGLLAHNFIDHGYDVVINGYIDEPAWTAIEKHAAITHKVLLLPEISVVKERDAGRSPDIQMGTDSVEEHHEYFSTDPFFKDFIALDTSNQSVDETVQQVLTIIKKPFEEQK